MKKSILLTLLSCFLFFHLRAQNTQEIIAKKWLVVYQYELDDLPKSALAAVDEIYQLAEKGNLPKQRIKALIYQSKFTLTLKEEAQLEIIERFEDEIQKSEAPEKNLLAAYLGEIYVDYYQRNRYRLNQRTETEGLATIENFHSWDGQTLLKAAKKQFEMALKEPQKLQKANIQDYHILLDLQDHSDKYRTSLYDLIAHHSLAFYTLWASNHEDDDKRFAIDKEEYFTSITEITLPESEQFQPILSSLKLYQSLLLHHQEEANIAATVALQIELLKYLKEHSQLHQKHHLYTQSLTTLAQRFAADEASSLLTFELAYTAYNSSNKKLALSYCEEGISNYPESEGAQKCKSLKQSLLKHSLNLSSLETIPMQQHSLLRVNYTNVDSLHVKVYRIARQASQQYKYFETDSAKDHFMASHKAIVSFTATLINPFDYSEHTTEILIPPLDGGNFVLLVEDASGEDEALYAYADFQVSNLALIENDLKEQKRFQVVDRLSGKPIKSASIDLTWGQKDKTFEKLTTDENGFAYFDYRKDYLRDISYLVYSGQDTISHNNNYIQRRYNYNRPSYYDKRVRAKAEIFTDRSIYRPGQEVFFKGILIKTQQEQKSVVAGEYVEVFLENVNDEEVAKIPLKTNEFGSFSGSFQLPQDGLNGTYTIIVEEDYEEDSKFYDNILDDFEYSSVGIQVEEYKRPTFEVVFDPVTASYSIGDTVSLGGKAKSFSGANISNAKISYTVIRKTAYQPWFGGGYFGSRFGSNEDEIFTGEAQTADDGSFILAFKATPDPSADKASQPTFTYEVKAQVTDINGESRSNETSIKLGYHRLEASIEMPEQIVKKEESKISLSITNLNGEAINSAGSLFFVKLEAPEYIPMERTWPMPDLPIISESDYKRYFPHEGDGSSKGFKDWPLADTLLTRTFDTNNSRTLTFKAKEAWPEGKYLLSLRTFDSLGNEVLARKYFDLSGSKQQPSTPTLFQMSKDKGIYELGEKLKLSVGSSSEDLSVTIDIHRNDEISETRIIQLSNEVKTITIPVEPSDQEGFAIFYQYANFNKFEQGTMLVAVKQNLPSLNIETLSFRDKLLPGGTENWSFKILGEDKKAAEAELLASMYDASLDQFKEHEWRFTPKTLNTYRAYNYSRAQGFGTNYFTVENLNSVYYSYPYSRYDDFNWFGFSFNGSNYKNRQYLNRLRSVFFTENNLEITQSHDKKKNEGYIYGQVVAKDGEPLPGVNILVKGTKRGTSTDIDGRYSLAAIKGEQILVAFIGMESTEITIGAQNTINIVLKTDVQQLSEVVVTGKGIKRERQALYAAVVEIADEEEMQLDMVSSLQGKVAGVQVQGWNWPDEGAPGATGTISIRGNSSINNSENPLFIIDGKIVASADIAAADIASVQVLKDAAATALYGARGANGVVIISTKKGQAALDKMLAQVEARTDFRETAFFFPQLKSNEQGEISFNFNSPEALTRWKLQLLAHNKALQVGYKQMTTITQKDLMVTPNAPRFLRRGDQLTLSAKISNLSETTLNGSIVLVLKDGISGASVDTIFNNTKAKQPFNIATNNTTEVSWEIKVPENCDALQYKIVATTGDYSDGEQNIIPILPNRQLVQESMPFTIRKAGTSNFTYDRLKDNQSASMQHQQLTFEITTNPIWYAIKAMPYLIEYPYECSEQTFSRYFANAVGSHLVDKNPSIKTVFERWKADGQLGSTLEQNSELKSLLIQETPWLRDAQSEAEQQKRIALLFELDKMKQEQETAISKLANMQLGNGGFPWFSGSDKASRSITQYIMMGFGQLQQITTDPAKEKLAQLIKEGVSYLDNALTKDYNSLLKKSKDEDDPIDLNKQHIDKNQIQLMYARSFFSDQISKEAQKAYNFYLKQSAVYWKEFDLQLRAMIAFSAFRTNNKDLAFKVFASIRENSITNDERGMYWKANTGGYYWHQAPIETQALIINLFQELGPELPKLGSQELEQDLENLRVWLIRNKQSNRWETTKSTTQAIYALLLNNAEQLTQVEQISVTLGAKEVEIGKQEMGAGYIKESWPAEAIESNMGNLSIQKQNDGLAYGAIHWQYFEDLDKITSDADGALSLTKQVYKLTKDAGKDLLVAITDSTSLALGDKLRIRMVLKVDREMEFLHMKDQRAAGLEPVNVISKYHWQDGLGYYQSTKDASTNFFFDSVEKGVYVFEYDLLVNNAGTFQNGITTIESMYAPEFKSHSEGMKLKLGK